MHLYLYFLSLSKSNPPKKPPCDMESIFKSESISLQQFEMSEKFRLTVGHDTKTHL